MPKCQRDGCENRVRRVRNRFCCAACSQSDQATISGASSVSGVTGKDTPEDILKRSNLDLQTELRKARQTIQTFSLQRSWEDRMIEQCLDHLTNNPYSPRLEKSAPDSKSKHAGDHELMLVLSDAHFPEVVDPLVAMGVSYNADICKRRLEYIRDTTLRYLDLKSKTQPVRKLTVAMIGDMLTGSIHEELEVTNAMPVSEAVIELAYMLHDMGRVFGASFPEVEWITMPGNHSRLTKKPRFKQKFDSWEYVLGHFLRALSVGHGYSVTTPKALMHVHRVFDTRIGLTHGDGVKAQSFAGIPFYSMKSRRDAFQALLRELGSPAIEMLIMGHFHQMLFWQGTGCDLFVNGSVIGGSEYSIATMYAVNEPVQGLLTFHQKHGLVGMDRINLGHIK